MNLFVRETFFLVPVGLVLIVFFLPISKFLTWIFLLIINRFPEIKELFETSDLGTTDKVICSVLITGGFLFLLAYGFSVYVVNTYSK